MEEADLSFKFQRAVHSGGIPSAFSSFKLLR
jgi:hypothetical protein